MSTAPSDLRQVASHIAATLAKHGISDSNLEAEVLLRNVLGFDRARFYASLDKTVTAENIECVHALTERRISHEPLAYIIGRREFYGLDFCVTPAVLIPRQETELLIDEALKFDVESHDGNISIADIGTGSGAIAVSVAVHLPLAKVYATDCSTDALKVADLNLHNHRVTDRITLMEGDLFAPLTQPVDLIISNPPYIASDSLPELDPEVRREPRLALDGGKNGLEVISRLIDQAPDKLNAGGRMIVEISPEQLDAIHAIAQAKFPNSDISYANDLLGLPRCVTISTQQ